MVVTSETNMFGYSNECNDEYKELPKNWTHLPTRVYDVCLCYDVWDQSRQKRSTSKSTSLATVSNSLSIIIYLLCLSSIAQVISVSAAHPLDTFGRLTVRSLHCPVPNCVCSPSKVDGENGTSLTCTNITMIPRLQDFKLDIQVLNLSRNSMSKVLGDSLLGMESLRVLDLSHNGIREVEDKALIDLDLHHLDLSHNNLIDLPSLPNTLKTLDLSYNHGLRLKMEDFADLSQLEDLGLAGIDLNSMDLGVLTPLWSSLGLNYVNLAANQIEQLREDHLDALTHVDKVDLSNNPISCDCRVLGFVRWLNDVNRTVTSGWSLPTCNTAEPICALTLANLKRNCPLMSKCNPLDPVPDDCQNLTVIGLNCMHRTSTASPQNISRIEFQSMRLAYDPMLGWWTAAALGGMVAALILCLIFEKGKQKIVQYRRRRWRRKCRRIWEAAKAAAGEDTNETDSLAVHNHPIFYSHEIQLDVVPDAIKMDNRSGPCAVVMDNQSNNRAATNHGGDRPPEYSRQSSRRLSVSWGPTSDLSSTSPSSTVTPTQDADSNRQPPTLSLDPQRPCYKKTLNRAPTLTSENGGGGGNSQSLLQYLERASRDIVTEVHPDCPIHNPHRKERLKTLLKKHPHRSLHAILTDEAI